jgi:REP element-mobilizing transposase RayT
MPVYLFTIHSYRSWNADHPRGFVQSGRGIQPPNAALAVYYDNQAKQEAVHFSERHQRTIVWITWDACQWRSWRVHAVAFESSHVHILVSWHSSDSWQTIRAKLKNLISWALSRDFGHEGHRWLVRKGSRKPVRDKRHFDYLVTNYLPRHGGIFWKEGDPAPVAPTWVRTVKAKGKPPSSDGGC